MICQLTTLKARLGILDSDTHDDAQLTRFIKLVGARFNRHTRRTLERSAAATHEFRAADRVIIPDRLPIESVTSFEIRGDQADAWETVTDAGYLIGPNGALIELLTALGAANEMARVTYAGGYVLPGSTPGTGQTALPDDLEQAAIEQVVYLWQNRNRLGLVSMGGQQGSLAQFAELDLLPMVKEILDSHVRITL